MKTSKIVLVLINALIEILLSSMKLDESNLDADGLPLNIEEYNRCGSMLAALRDIVSFSENSL